MNDPIIHIVKFYAIMGGMTAFCMALYVVLQLNKATDIISRGNNVRVSDGPTFKPGSYGRMFDYFILVCAMPMSAVAFFIWPYVLYKWFGGPPNWFVFSWEETPEE